MYVLKVWNDKKDEKKKKNYIKSTGETWEGGGTREGVVEGLTLRGTETEC